MSKMKRGATLAVFALALVSLASKAHAQEPNPMAQQAPPDDNKITRESEGVYLYKARRWFSAIWTQ